MTYIVNFTSLRGFGEVDVVSASFNGADSVTFDEMGTPNAGGTVVLRAGPHVYTISVAAVTGDGDGHAFLTIDERNGGTCDCWGL